MVKFHQCQNCFCSCAFKKSIVSFHYQRWCLVSDCVVKNPYTCTTCCFVGLGLNSWQHGLEISLVLTFLLFWSNHILAGETMPLCFFVFDQLFQTSRYFLPHFEGTWKIFEIDFIQVKEHPSIYFILLRNKYKTINKKKYSTGTFKIR